jgi:hypothetical protein
VIASPRGYDNHVECRSAGDFSDLDRPKSSHGRVSVVCYDHHEVALVTIGMRDPPEVGSVHNGPLGEVPSQHLGQLSWYVGCRSDMDLALSLQDLGGYPGLPGQQGFDLVGQVDLAIRAIRVKDEVLTFRHFEQVAGPHAKEPRVGSRSSGQG